MFIQRFLLSVLIIFLLAPVACSNIKVAVVYNSFQNYIYKDEMLPILNELNWKYDSYENTEISKLVSQLNLYDLILLSAVYNYENPQDFSIYANEWREYLNNGGCVISTDTNYPQLFEWLPKIDPRLKWICTQQHNSNDNNPVKLLNELHPLVNDISISRIPWTQCEFWSQALTPIALDINARPVISYVEIGKGIFVISSNYRQYGFPDAKFLQNLIEWSNDVERIESALENQMSNESYDVHSELNAALNKINHIYGFVDLHNKPSEQKTECKVIQRSDYLNILFTCYQDNISSLSAFQTEHDSGLWTDDCVNVYINPDGKGQNIHHFGVNSIGTKYDSLNNDKAWDAYWKSTITKKFNCWEANFEIPYSSLGIKKDAELQSDWRINFDRQYHSDSKYIRDISGWSYSSAGFDDIRGFGKINGMSIDTSPYTVHSELVATVPSKWIIGTNIAAINFADEEHVPEKSIIECININSGEVLGKSSYITGKMADVPIDIKTEGRKDIQFILKNNKTILASSKVIKLYASPILEVEMMLPAFRNSLQSKDPQKILWLKGNITTNEDDSMILRTSITREHQSTPIKQLTQNIKPLQKTIEIKSKIGDLLPGKYIVMVELLREDKLISWKSFDLSVHPPALMEVTFDDKHVCYVNGKPLFPIGLYHTSPVVIDRLNAANQIAGLPELTLNETLQDIKNHGFNTIHYSWAMADEEYLKTAQQLGLYAIPEVGAPEPSVMESFVNTANKYNNLLIWYGIDEPAGDKLRAAISAYEMFKEADPHRPVSAAVNNPNMFDGAALAYDIFMPDPYFIRFAPLTQISDWLIKGSKASSNKKPTWVVPQAFTISNSAWSEPTREELRCQAYLSLVHGATGLIWYALWTSEPYYENPKGRNQWYLPDSDLWEYFTVLNSQIQAFSNVIFNGESVGNVKCSNESIQTNMWKYGRENYVIAVNPTDKPITCTINITAKKAAIEEIHNDDGRNKIINCHNGGIAVSFEPLEVHVYKF